MGKDAQVAYRQWLRRKRCFILLLAVVLVLVALLSLRIGSLAISWSELLTALTDRLAAPRLGHVVWRIRLPRTVVAVLAGAGLGVAGAVMQTVLRNPLASPFTIGVSQGAAGGAAFAIIVLGAGAGVPGAGSQAAMAMGVAPYLVVISAFTGAMLAVFFILLLTSVRRVTPEAVILAGVALSAFFGAATMLLQYFASDLQVAATVFWTFGDLGKAGWVENLILLPAVVLPLTWFMFNRWNYNALHWGDDTAASLGVRVGRLRILTLVLAALCVATITAFLGVIGFVGLLAPHLMRLLMGPDHRHLIPAAALCGGLVLALSDIVARTLLAPVILPVGIITSLAGAPLFLYLLIKGRSREAC